MKMKKSYMMLVFWAVVLGMTTLNVSADRENTIPDEIIIHDSCVEDEGLIEPIIAPATDEGGEMVIAPTPVVVDNVEENEIEPLIIMPYDQGDFVDFTDNDVVSNDQYSAVSAVGPLCLLGVIGGVFLTKRRKKIE